MFEDYFKTSEEAGSLYRVEDLLGVVRTGDSVDDLKRFLNRWDATIAGMETPPDDLVLRDILLRQIRKCHLMKYDIEALDRESEKSEQKPYAFLLQNIRDLLDRERLRSKRNRMVENNKQGSDKPQPAAPRSARLPSHPYQPHRAGHVGPSLPYVGYRLDPSWRILGRCWAHVDVF